MSGSYTTPKNWSTGSTVVEADLDTYVSTIETELQNSLPLAASSWTPTLTASTTNPTYTSSTCRSITIGGLVTVSFTITFTTAGSGTYSMTVPVNANTSWQDATNFRTQGDAWVTVGSSHVPLWVRLAAGGTSVQFVYATNLTGSVGLLSNAAPLTIAANSVLAGQFSYEPA